MITTFLLAVQQVLAQVSLGREGHVAEATLCNGLLLVLVVAAHFADVFLEVGESSKQTAAFITLERSQVIMASPDMHGDCGVVPECHTTPRGVKQKTLVTYIVGNSLPRAGGHSYKKDGGGGSSVILKRTLLRGTKILFCGRDLNFCHP